MSVRNMKSIRSYEDGPRIIENFHANYRGRLWHPSTAPLDEARSKHIFAEHAHGEVRCTLYETDLVTYMPGRQVKIKPHTSDISMQFYDATLPPGLRAKRIGYCLYILTNDRYYLISGHGTVFEYNHGCWNCVEGVLPIRYARLQWRKIPKINRMIQPIIEWQRAMHRLGAKFNAPPTPPDVPMEEIVRDPAYWASEFGNKPYSSILNHVARGMGLLTFDTMEYLTEAPKRPKEKWTNRLPQLHNVAHLELI